MAKKRKAKIKRKRAAKKSKAKKRSTRKVDVLSTVSDEALERSAILPTTAACTARHCL
jgi:hypothetical protein